MSKDRLARWTDRDHLRSISWFGDEGEGATLGDGHPHDPKSQDEHDIASRAAYDAATPCEVAHSGYKWATTSEATKALRAANAALKVAQSKVSVPGWAQKALAAGWKMPKGWKP